VELCVKLQEMTILHVLSAVITCEIYIVTKMDRYDKYQSKKYTHTHTLAHATDSG